MTKPDQSGKGTPQPADFLLEWYKLQRAHELELNRATASYEHERLKILSYFNGAGAAVFLTLLGATLKTSGPPPFWPAAFFAIFLWAVGLLATFGAFACGHNGQRAYSKAYRKRRQVEEVRRFGIGVVGEEGKPASARVRELFGIDEINERSLQDTKWFKVKLIAALAFRIKEPTGKICDEFVNRLAKGSNSQTAECICKRIASNADKERRVAERSMKCAWRLTWVSVICFGLGLFPASVTFVDQDLVVHALKSIVAFIQGCSEASSNPH